MTPVCWKEGVGKYSTGNMSKKELLKLESVACPSSGSCGGQFTANTMACVSEAIGLALPGSAGTPAVYETRDKFAVSSGHAVMNLLKKNIRPRDIVTKKSLENAAVVVAASGGSTNAALHLPAIANEAGIKFTLEDVTNISRKTPYIADLKPGGKYVAKDLYEIGGVPILIKALLEGGYLHEDCMTVSGKTIGENHKNITFPSNQKIIYKTSKPISPSGGFVGLKGNLAPEGAIVKVAGMKRRIFKGKAKCFDGEKLDKQAVLKRKIKPGDVML
jgi:Dihydroxyacid dehydratase/phosphogluconate dehydratase